MYCQLCAQPITSADTMCPRCGQPTGVTASPRAQGFGAPPGQPSGGFAPREQYFQGGTPYRSNAALAGPMPKQRIAYILLGLFLGTLGVHNFYAGYTGKAVAQLLITLLTGWLGIPLLAVMIWNIVEICTVDRDASGVPMS